MTHIYQGVVINQRSFRDDDLLVDIYTSQRGKLTTLVKGGKKILSKLRSGIEVLNWVEIMVAEGRNFTRLAAVNSLASWPNLRQDFTSLTLALALVEVVDKITGEAVREDEVYHLLLHWLGWLDNNHPSQEEGLFWFYLVSLRLLARAGYDFLLDRCSQCDRLFDLQTKVYYSATGVVCEGCHTGNDLLLEQKLYQLLEKFLHKWLIDKIGEESIFVTYQDKRKELAKIGEEQLKQVIERPLLVFNLLTI